MSAHCWSRLPEEYPEGSDGFCGFSLKIGFVVSQLAQICGIMSDCVGTHQGGEPHLLEVPHFHVNRALVGLTNDC